MSKEFDMETFKNELLTELEEKVERMFNDTVDKIISNAVEDYLPETLNECLSDYEFILNAY